MATRGFPSMFRERSYSSTRERGRSRCRDCHTMSPYPHCEAYPDEGNQAPLQGCLIPSSCSRTDGRSTAQPVGSFVTKASLLSPKVVSNAPVVVGKSEDSVRPVT